MKQGFKKELLLGIIGVCLFFLFSSSVSHAAPINHRLYLELLKLPTDGKIVPIAGVPCLKIFLKKGQSITSLCESVDYLDRKLIFHRQQIALINGLDFTAEVGAAGNLGTDVKFVYVPLNFSIRPEILPEWLESAENLPKFILIDLDKQCLGLYEYGNLVDQFPVSSGDHGTPARKFVILSKELNHYSTEYNMAWMPFALRLFGNYYLHAGILPGYAASHGCVRMIYENAVIVYNWADVGTPGEVVKGTGKLIKEEPEPDEETPAQQMETPQPDEEQPAQQMEEPDPDLENPAVQVEAPESDVEKPAPQVESSGKLPPTHDLKDPYRDFFAPDSGNDD